MPAREHRDVKRIFLALALCLAAVLVAATDARAEAAKATAVLAGGCFWCVEHDFRQLPGVTKAVSGYSGGSRPNPTYENYHDVDAENPVPHVEVAQITYDPSKLSYATLLDYYFRHIDPTDREGQFCDRGPAYRPVIFVANEEERKVAEAKKAEVAELIKQPVAVEIADVKTFWPAEEYHQAYANKNPVRYKLYRWNCGRDQRVKEIWSAAKTQ
jgi:peptide-methionine (S)-S-oxide reductase